MEIPTCRSFAPPRSRLLTVSALALLLGQTDALAYTVKTTFPRLGGTKIGAPHAYKDAAVQSQLAKLDYVLIDFFPNWGSVTTMRDAVKAIKAKSPNVVILDHVIQETIHNTHTATVCGFAAANRRRYILTRFPRRFAAASLKPARPRPRARGRCGFPWRFAAASLKQATARPVP